MRLLFNIGVKCVIVKYSISIEYDSLAKAIFHLIEIITFSNISQNTNLSRFFLFKAKPTVIQKTRLGKNNHQCYY